MHSSVSMLLEFTFSLNHFKNVWTESSSQSLSRTSGDIMLAGMFGTSSRILSWIVEPFILFIVLFFYSSKLLLKVNLVDLWVVVLFTVELFKCRTKTTLAPPWGQITNYFHKAGIFEFHDACYVSVIWDPTLYLILWDQM